MIEGRTGKEGTLSIVATPIGNLEDVTLRALRVLKEADCVLCEDTRVTKKLLAKHGIRRTIMSYHAHSDTKQTDRILRMLEEGKHLALVSDAGTPGVSDPGVQLVMRAGEAGARVEAIPGPSALTAAFSIAGVPGNQFCFLGYAPQKKGRETFFKKAIEFDLPVIFFESTHRIMKTLETLAKSDTAKTVIVARELTKLHEEVVRGSAAEILAYFKDNPDHQKGEFVILAANKKVAG